MHDFKETLIDLMIALAIFLVVYGVAHIFLGIADIP